MQEIVIEHNAPPSNFPQPIGERKAQSKLTIIPERLQKMPQWNFSNHTPLLRK